MIGQAPTERQPPTSPQTIGVAASVSVDDRAIPCYDHLFVIIAENKSYSQIVGSSDTPTLNRLAKTYGLTTHF